MVKFVFCLFLFYFTFCVAEKYTTVHENVDIDDILTNDKLFDIFFACLMDTGKCSPDAKELKSYLPDALNNNCSICNERQKGVSKKVLNYMIEYRREKFNGLAGKYDPEGSYMAKYRAEADKP